MTKPPSNPLLDMLALSNIPRWAIVDMRKEQSVADHSFRVAIIALELRNRMDTGTQDVMGELVLYALMHDVEESRSGDIPPEYKALIVAPAPVDAATFDPGEVLDRKVGNKVGDTVRRLVKLADLIEALTFILRHGTGDAHTKRIISDLNSKISVQCASAEQHQIVRNLIVEIVDNVR